MSAVISLYKAMAVLTRTCRKDEIFSLQNVKRFVSKAAKRMTLFPVSFFLFVFFFFFFLGVCIILLSILFGLICYFLFEKKKRFIKPIPTLYHC